MKVLHKVNHFCFIERQRSVLLQVIQSKPTANVRVRRALLRPALMELTAAKAFYHVIHQMIHRSEYGIVLPILLVHITILRRSI